MANILRANGSKNNILRVNISSTTFGTAKTGLAYNTSGLVISTIADNEATAVAYTVAGSTVETIATLGTYAAPTATKCRFKEVDSTNHPGLYELQLADARFAVAGAKSLTITISGTATTAPATFVVDLAAIATDAPGTNVVPADGTLDTITAEWSRA